MAGELLDLAIGDDKELRERVTARVYKVILTSFQADGSRVTRVESTRRFRICETALRELRAEHGWAFDRILDALPTILRAKLDGVAWDPTKQRAMWLG